MVREISISLLKSLLHYMDLIGITINISIGPMNQAFIYVIFLVQPTFRLFQWYLKNCSGLMLFKICKSLTKRSYVGWLVGLFFAPQSTAIFILGQSAYLTIFFLDKLEEVVNQYFRL